MHRNTFVLTIALTIIAALIIGVNLSKPKTAIPEPVLQDPQVSAPPSLEQSASPQPLTYTNDTCGIQFQYPPGVNKLENAGGAVFSDPESSTSAVIVTCQQEIPRPPLAVDRIEDVVIGSISAKLYHNASPKDGTPIDEVIFLHPGRDIDVYIAGMGKLFQDIIHSLNIL